MRSLAVAETKLEMQCIWCKRTYGFKNGHGQTGISSGVCSDCCALCGATDRGRDKDGLCPECVLNLELIEKANARRGKS